MMFSDPPPGERFNGDWLKAYLKYTEATEAPPHMHFWSGVSAIAGALRRQVWVDQTYFRWYPNFYIVLVAPPGIVSKSTTAGIAMGLLRDVPGIHFGPDVVTWQSLVERFSASTEQVELEPETHPGILTPMSAMTMVSSEFGNLLDPKDAKMVDLLVSLWDCEPGAFEKVTKGSGNDTVENPWINIIACTTPSWIHGNFPEYMIGGGFTSRTVFVYADKKARYIPYPFLMVPENHAEQREKLVKDLDSISKLKGRFTLTKSALDWGSAWYDAHYKSKPINLDMDHFGGYFARKQVQMHKLAMVLSASEGNSMIITEDHLKTADAMITDLEPDLQFVFRRIGQSDTAVHVEKLISFIVKAGKDGVPYADAYRHVHGLFPSMRDFEDIILGCVRSGYIKHEGSGTSVTLRAGDVTLPESSGRQPDGKRKGA